MVALGEVAAAAELCPDSGLDSLEQLIGFGVRVGLGFDEVVSLSSLVMASVGRYSPQLTSHPRERPQPCRGRQAPRNHQASNNL